jgi:hypothetical protein
MYVTTALLSLFLQSSLWGSNLEYGLARATKEKKLVLLYFSGSDWNTESIKMQADIFRSNKFIDFAQDNLVLVNIDSPRSSRAQATDSQKFYNSVITEGYNPDNILPLLLILDEKGKVLKVWRYNPRLTAGQIIQSISVITGIPVD